VLTHLANEPIPDSPNFRAAFHNPGLFVPTPLCRDTLLSLYADGVFVESDLDILNGCYLQLEQEAEGIRLRRFIQGNASCLVLIRLNSD
jgi:hypothetical protein